MDIMSYIDTLFVPIIVVASLCIGYIMKHWLPTDNKWIPTVLFVFGIISGLMVVGVSFEGAVCGAVSSLASVGIHQTFTQHMKLPMGDDEFYSMGAGEEEAEDEQ